MFSYSELFSDKQPASIRHVRIHALRHSWGTVGATIHRVLRVYHRVWREPCQSKRGQEIDINIEVWRQGIGIETISSGYNAPYIFQA